MASDKKRRKQIKAKTPPPALPGPFRHRDGDRRRRFGVLYREGLAAKRALQHSGEFLPPEEPDSE